MTEIYLMRPGATYILLYKIKNITIHKQSYEKIKG